MAPSLEERAFSKIVKQGTKLTGPAYLSWYTLYLVSDSPLLKSKHRTAKKHYDALLHCSNHNGLFTTDDPPHRSLFIYVAAFDSLPSFLSVLAHELTHATEHLVKEAAASGEEEFRCYTMQYLTLLCTRKLK